MYVRVCVRACGRVRGLTVVSVTIDKFNLHHFYRTIDSFALALNGKKRKCVCVGRGRGANEKIKAGNRIRIDKEFWQKFNPFREACFLGIHSVEYFNTIFQINTHDL